MDQPISLAPTPVEQEPIDLRTTQKTNPLSAEIASMRAAKAHLGMAENWQRTFDEIYQGMINGDEDLFREEAASVVDDKNTKKKQRIILQEVVNNNHNIDPYFLSDLDAQLPPSNPKSVFEKAYAERFMGELDKFAERDGDTLWNKAYKEIPVITERARLLGTGEIASMEFAKKLQQDAVETLKRQSWAGWSADLVKDLASFGLYSEYNLRGLSPDVSFFYGLLGSNLEDSTRSLMALPPGQREEKITAIYNQFKERNPTLALTFANALVGQSVSERRLNDIISATNIGSIPSLAKAGASLGKQAVLANEVRNAVKDITKKAATTPPTKAGLAEAVGDLGEAAVQRNADTLISEFKGTNKPAQDAIDNLASGLKIQSDAIDTGVGHLGTGINNILKNETAAFSDRMLATLSTMSQIQRIPIREATEQVLRALKERVKDFYPGLRNAILDVSNPRYEPFSNTYNYDLKIGDHAGLLFSDEGTARAFAELNNLKGVVDVDKEALQRSGLGYFIRLNKPLNETDDLIRDLFVNTDLAKSPKFGLFGSAASWLRTPEDTMSQLQRINRKVVTYSQAQLRKLADEERKLIDDLKYGTSTYEKDDGFFRRPYRLGMKLKEAALRTNKNKWNDLERTLKNNQELKDELGRPGYFFQSPQELDDFYMFAFKRLPDPDEVRAYFAHKRLNELDRVIRNIEVYRNKARVGAESHKINVLGPDGKTFSSIDFDGVQRDRLPHGDDGILVVGDSLGKERMYRNTSAISKKEQDRLNEAIKKGELKAIEIYDPETRPFKEFGDKVQGRRIRWVIAKNVETNPLSWDQVPYRAGGHFEYEYDYFIKQAKIRPEQFGNVFKHWYEGDSTVMPIAVGAQGRDLVEKMNAVRELIDQALRTRKSARQPLMDQAEALARATLPVEWKEFKSWFLPRHVNGTVEPSRLDSAEPFVLTQKDALIANIDKSLERRYAGTFVDGTKHGSLARQFTVKFTGERDAYDMFTVNNYGTAKNPIYKYEPAKLVDPITMLNRGLSRVMNSNLMDDYKVFSVEHWVKEASNWLDASDSRIKYAPFQIFYDPKWKADTPKEIKWQLLSNKFKIEQLLGQPSYVDLFMHSAQQKLADFLYDKIGPKAALIPSWLLPKAQDPIGYIRGMVYHMKLGLFALPQVVVQNMTYASIVGLSPRHVTSGVAGALFHKWAELNPRMLSKIDDYASRLRVPGTFGFKKGQFTEAFEELQKTGFDVVGGEYVNLDHISNYKVTKSAGAEFLDWGQSFFKMGERSVRLGAWYTAFSEFRRANPTGRITQAERAKILDRADLLTTNMSRASASAMHTGAFSLTSQFLSYQIRLSELFFSKRLGETLLERNLARARLLGVYSTLFGFPVATGLSGVPLGEYIRKSAIENGYVVGDNWLSTMINEGIPSWMIGMTTGNYYNIGTRFGSQGFEVFKEALRGDKPWWNLVGGAAFNSMSNIWSSTDGFTKAMLDGIRGTGEFSLKPEDFIDPLKEIQSVNAVWHAIYAANTGNWLSKKEYVLTKTSPLNAVLMSAFGLSPQGVNDVFTKTWSIKDREDAQNYALQKFTQEFRRGLQAADDKNYSQSKDYLRRAFSWLRAGGYPEENYAKAIALASDRDKTLIERIDWKFYLEDVPEDKKQTYLQAFKNSVK
jgi:hypothetical protein